MVPQFVSGNDTRVYIPTVLIENIIGVIHSFVLGE